MQLQTLWQRFESFGNSVAIIAHDQKYSYRQLLAAMKSWKVAIAQAKVSTGDVLGIQSDYSLESIALFLSALQSRIHVVVLPAQIRIETLSATMHLDFIIGNHNEFNSIEPVQSKSEKHEYFNQLRDSDDVGFVVLSSGTTGKPKAILHSATRFFSKFTETGKPFTTLAFLLFDHIAGIDTLFYTLNAGGSLVLPTSRQPTEITRLIEQHKVEVLPTSPSFLNLWNLSGALDTHNFTSLKIVTYGSEVMPQRVLAILHEKLPDTRLIQKYGASEFGSPSSKSRGDSSPWIKLNGDNFHVKVEAGLLWVRAKTSMIGYLNADQPVTVDGWVCTGDQVEVDGEWMRILGRESQLINVGGEKVYPSEVEEVLQKHQRVIDVVVNGRPHALLGNEVVATITHDSEEDTRLLKSELKILAKKNLSRYKQPTRYEFSTKSAVNERHKKVR